MTRPIRYLLLPLLMLASLCACEPQNDGIVEVQEAVSQPPFSGFMVELATLSWTRWDGLPSTTFQRNLVYIDQPIQNPNLAGATIRAMWRARTADFFYGFPPPPPVNATVLDVATPGNLSDAGVGLTGWCILQMTTQTHGLAEILPGMTSWGGLPAQEIQVPSNTYQLATKLPAGDEPGFVWCGADHTDSNAIRPMYVEPAYYDSTVDGTTFWQRGFSPLWWFVSWDAGASQYDEEAWFCVGGRSSDCLARKSGTYEVHMIANLTPAPYTPPGAVSYVPGHPFNNHF